jgi:hypothetical protein
VRLGRIKTQELNATEPEMLKRGTLSKIGTNLRGRFFFARIFQNDCMENRRPFMTSEKIPSAISFAAEVACRYLSVIKDNKLLCVYT